MYIPSKPRKGRGAITNPTGRFESRRVFAVDDGWAIDAQEELPPLSTTVTAERAKSIISRNDSPDIPFEQSINPYRGCGHGCIYCAAGDTQILMADGQTKQLGELKIGDEIVGTARRGFSRRYVKTQVLAHWETRKPAYRVLLAGGRSITASADHRFLSDRGWGFVGPRRRHHLTTSTRLMGIGSPAEALGIAALDRRGYPCGLVEGDGRSTLHDRASGTGSEALESYLALVTADGGSSQRSCSCLAGFEVQLPGPESRHSGTARNELHRAAHPRDGLQGAGNLSAWPGLAPIEWLEGFPGIQLPASKMHLRFFRGAAAGFARKRSIFGQMVKSHASLNIVEIEPLGKSMPMYDITTGTGDFIANGVVSHNCFARPAHSYVNLSPGLDFETKLFYKDNAAELLQAELSRPRYVCKSINLGANTDPYQPIERKLKVTRSILEVLQKFRHPVTIVTKGHLVERDIDILSEMARDNLAAVHVSVTTLDSGLKRILEPRAPSAAARLQAMKALHAAGIPVGALVAPVIPAINDHEIEHILEAVAQTGARSAAYVMLRLPYEVKDLFREWLAAHYPLRAAHVMAVVNDVRGGRDNDPRFGSRMSGTGVFAPARASAIRRGSSQV